MATLYSIRYSPWSLQAKWALAYHDSDYSPSEYLPLTTEWKLRFILRDFRTKISVPILIDTHGNALRESLDIARWSAAHQGPNSRGDLFAQSCESILEWSLKGAQILNFGRNRNFEKILENDAAMMSMLPKFMQSLGFLGSKIGRFMVRRVQRKYANEEGANDVERARESLIQLRQALKENGGYILGKFSYADVAMAISLQMVMPSKAVFPMKPHLFNLVSIPSFCEEFQDLGEWRDKIVEDHYFSTRTGKMPLSSQL